VKLDEFLQEARKEFTSSQEADSRTAEMKRHLIEKARYRYGKADQDALERTVDSMGDPMDFAQRFVFRPEFIRSSYTNLVFMFTAMVFAVHFWLYMLALILQESVWLIPFVGVRSSGLLSLLYLVPQVFLFDFGLVCLLFYITTRNDGQYKFRWVERFLRRQNKTRTRKRVMMILMRAAVIAAIVLVLLTEAIPWLVGVLEESGVIVSYSTVGFVLLLVIGLLSIDFVVAVSRLLGASKIVDVIGSLSCLLFLWFMVTEFNELSVVGSFAEPSVPIAGGVRALFIVISTATAASMTVRAIQHWGRRASELR